MSDFEQWYISEHSVFTLLKDSEGNYVRDEVREASEVWQAAKQSMQGEANFDLSACLNAVADMGFWPQVIYDDNGNWAIWDEGSSNIRLDDDQDYQCSFLIPAEYFKPSLQEAWSCYVEKLKELGNDVSKLYTHAPESAARIAEQDARIKELEQQLEVARKDAEWQPIEMAPKDGTLLMVYSRTHGYVAAWWDQVDGGGHPENGPPVYWWVSDLCEFIDGPYDAPLMWKPLNELSDTVIAAIRQIGGAE